MYKFTLFLILISVSPKFQLNAFRLAEPTMNSQKSLNENTNMNRIIGGQTAKRGQFPYQVSLRFSEHLHLCGGSIIKHDWIITAAHCTFRTNFEYMAIAVGAHHITDDGYLYSIQNIVEHPKFTIWALTADISLIQTCQSIVYSADIQPIAIGTKEYIDGGIEAVASGWGTILVS